MKRFLIIWAGELLSTIGSGLSAFGLGVYVYRQTGMATATVLVSLLGFCQPCCWGRWRACWRIATIGAS